MGKILGIDLGTSTSEIAVINENGKKEIIPNHLGGAITPSIVYIAEDGHPIVGEGAREKLFLEPENTFMEVKRLMGSNTVLESRGKNYSPAQISSFILSYLQECAKEHLNEDIKKAVITVPAYFTDVQRKETIEAGRLAGLDVVRIINEPTAASLDYGTEHMENCEYILIYDLGGGTLDVTLLELFEGAIEVKSSSGNNKLGGKDFDEALINHITAKVNKGSLKIEKDQRAMVRIKKAAEDCKIALSSENEYEIDLPFLTSHNEKSVSYNEKITREFFEGLISDMVKSTGREIKNALADGGIVPDGLDLVLLVGGSTKIPYVKKFLKDDFGFEPKTLINPDLAVVYGAAVQGGIISESMQGAEAFITMTDVSAHTLSVKTRDPGSIGGELICTPLIKRNTTIPVIKSEIFTTSRDYQTAVDIEVYQGEEKYPDENLFLGKFRLSGVPSARAYKERIKISFSYNLNGMLEVTAMIMTTGKQANIEIDTKKAIEKAEDLSNWAKHKNAKGYRVVIKKAESLIKEYKKDGFRREVEHLIELVASLKRGIIEEEDEGYLDEIKEKIMDEFYELEE